MESEKEFIAYIFDKKTYLCCKWEHNSYYLANGTIKGVPQSGQYPDYILFDCVAEQIEAIREQSPTAVLSHYAIKEKFVGLPGRLPSLPPETGIVDAEIYDKVFVNVSQPDLKRTMKIKFIDKNNIPVLPNWCKFDDIYRWHITNISDLSKFPCYVPANVALDMLCKRAKEIIELNPEIFSRFYEYHDCGYIKKISVRKKKFSNNEEEISIEQYYHKEPIKGKDFPDLKERLESYINHYLKPFLQDVMVDLPVFNNKLPVGAESYFEVKDRSDTWVCIKMDHVSYNNFMNYMGSDFEKALKQSKIGKVLFPIFSFIKKVQGQKPKYTIKLKKEL